MEENIIMVPGSGTKVIVRDVKQEIETAFLDYSMSVIVARALPDVRDGLKPVHRRILYTMHERGNDPQHPYRKSADTVGAVLGSYHPHGDASVYDAMVRLAQDFSLRYPLVDGQGNFGSVDGDPPAAYRYTEARMSKMACEMLTDIEKDTIDWDPNFDETKKEPHVLPSRFPNLLVNGSQGIAVGMATNIPPHNLREIVNGMVALMDDPEIDLAGLMEYVKGPDFPTGGIIMGRSGIRAAYATGRGKITLRGRAEIIEKKNGRYEILISEIPYMVNKTRLIESIADLVKDKRIEGISDLNDESSSRTGMKIVIEIKKDANPQVVLNQLYRFTQLQDTVGVIMLALDDGVPKIMSLKTMMERYIEFQMQVIRRRTAFELKKAKEREHILEGLHKAVDIVDEIIATIRACKGGFAEARQAVMDNFGFDELQADAIVKLQLGRLAGLEILKIEQELGELRAAIADFEEIVYNKSNNYGYELHPDYESLFRLYNGLKSNEMIFSIQNMDGNVAGHAIDIVSYYGNKSTMRLIASNLIVPSTHMVDMYENKDGSKFDWDDVFPGFDEGDSQFRRQRLCVAIDEGSNYITDVLDCDTTKVLNAYRERDPRLCWNVITPYSYYLGTDAGSNPRDKWFVLADPTKGGSPMEAQSFIRNSEGWNSYFWRKWIPTGNMDGYWGEYTRTPYEFPLIRLGDVLLMLAEAYNEKGDLDKAILEVNKIRARVNMPGLNSGAAWLHVANKEEMTQRIRDERAYELVGEGQRYWDLKRWGILESTVKDATDIFGDLMYEREYQPRHEIWPIPLVEMERNPNLVQNEGWE